MKLIEKIKSKLLVLVIFGLFFGAFPSFAANNPQSNISDLSPASQDKFNTSDRATIVSDPSATSAYILGPQNVLQIKIFGDGTTNQIYRVDESGYIKHALLGAVRVGGMSVANAEKLMEDRLADGYIIDPRVTIFVMEHSRFSVIGEVKKPGNYELLGKVSVIEAISMAGGFTGVANQRGVKIIRKSEGRESTINVDATRITEAGDVTANVPVEADDVVVVSKSFF